MSSNNFEFEAAKAVIGNVQICQAYLLAVVHNLEMTIYSSQNTLRNLEKLSQFVNAENKRQKAEANLAAQAEAKNPSFFKRFLGGGEIVIGIGEGEVLNSDSEVPTAVVSEEVMGAELSPTNTNEVVTATHDDEVLTSDQVPLEGGKIDGLYEFSDKLKKRGKDFKTIDLLIETVDLLSMAHGYITNNENAALLEAREALLCIGTSLVIGVPLEATIDQLQFSSSSSSNRLIDHSATIQTFNSTIGRLSSILQKLFAVASNLQEDVTDTRDLVEQVKTIVFSRSAENQKTGILKWFTSQSNDPIKSDMILNAIESIFSSMDRVVHYSTNAFDNISALKKIPLGMISFSSLPGLHSQNKQFFADSNAKKTAT
jgi:hypothetical protein